MTLLFLEYDKFDVSPLFISHAVFFTDLHNHEIMISCIKFLDMYNSTLTAEGLIFPCLHYC
jgi:hypothetical protein